MVLRIFKTIATSGFLTASECTKFVFGRGLAPDPTGGAYSAHPDPLAGLRGPTSKGGWGRAERKRRRGEKGNGSDRPPFRGEPSCDCGSSAWHCSLVVSDGHNIIRGVTASFFRRSSKATAFR